MKALLILLVAGVLLIALTAPALARRTAPARHSSYTLEDRGIRLTREVYTLPPFATSTVLSYSIHSR